LCKLAFKVIHSTTKLLPAWHTILQELQMPVTNIPQDVTKWNLTYDMLEYVLTHCKAMDTLMQQRELGLRNLELTDNEWLVVGQLQSTSKVMSRTLQMSSPGGTSIIKLILSSLAWH
ncbi:hypothetical protein BDR05DRAFT_880104, partial [Suillus weaverae]